MSRCSSLIVAGLAVATAVLVSAAAPAAQQPPNPWTQPFEPFTIAGNIHYVGSADLASYLITSDAGHVLLDTGSQTDAALLVASIERLGFKLRDIKVLLNTQAHYDHAAGFAELKKRSGARLLASPQDAIALEAGGKNDFAFGDDGPFPAVKVDERLKDGQVVTVGPIALTARMTPGHTKGSVSWTMTVKDQGRDYQVVFPASLSINPGVVLNGNKKYPAIKTDLVSSIAMLRTLQPDFFLAQHAGQFQLVEKRDRQKAGAKPSPFIDPEGYRTWLAKSEQVILAHP